MTDQDRTKQLDALSKLRRHLDIVFEKHKFPPAVLWCLDDVDDALRLAEVELGVDWGKRLESWEQGKPKGEED